jgi:hemerythrin-like metal-binding protein
MEELRKTQFKIALAAFLVLAGGTGGFMLIEPDWTLLDALYMTIITITTIGFGEVRPLSPAGRVFTIFLIASGIGVVTAASAFLARFIVEGELQGAFRRKKMHGKIKKLKDHYIVCGYGRIGGAICLKLFELDIPFVVIDADPQRCELALRRGFPVLGGKAAEDETLLAAGVRRAAGVVPCLRDDAANVFISLAARELNPEIYIISRASEPDIESRMIRAGADAVVYPLRLGGEQIARMVAEQAGKKPREEWSDACSGLLGYHLKMYRSYSETPIPVSQAKQEAHAASAVALRRESGETIENPDDATLLQRGDHLVCIVNLGAAAPASDASEQFAWSDEYLVGVDAIDEEHRVLFRYGRDFEHALTKGLRADDLNRIFERLLRYTERHFANEEELMRERGAPGLKGHIKLHQQLTLDVMALYKEKSRVHPRTVVDFMANRLIKHITVCDPLIARHLEKSSVAERGGEEKAPSETTG